MSIPVIKTNKFYSYSIEAVVSSTPKTTTITSTSSVENGNNDVNNSEDKKALLSKSIVDKGEEIRLLKVNKPPTLKEELAPLIQELLNLKKQYKELTGEEYGATSTTINTGESKVAAVEEKKKEGPSKSELNKLKKKENKLAKRAEEKGNTPSTSSKVGNDDTGSVKTNGAGVNPQAVDADAADGVSALYGDLPLIRSAYMTDKVYKQIKDLAIDMAGQKIWLRGNDDDGRTL